MAGPSGDTTTVQKADPWSGVQPFLTDIYDAAQGIYGTGAGTAPYSGDQLAELPSWMTGNIEGTIQGSQAQMPGLTSAIWGGLSPALTGTGINPMGVSANQVSGSMIGNTPQSSWLKVNPGTAQAAQTGWANVAPGGVSGDMALLDSLYGGVDNPYLSGMANDLVGRTQQSWQDMARSVNDQLTGSVLPGIQDDFQAAGSLGASRQALMQGQAIGKAADALAREGGELNQNLMGQLSNLYGGANEANENRVASLAGQLAGMGSQERLSQANLIQQALMANAGFGQEANLANLQAMLQGQLANQSAFGNMSQANQQAAMQALLANQGVDMQAMLANQGADMQAQLANQSTAYNADLQNMLAQMQAVGMVPGMASFPLNMSSQYLSAYSPILQQQQALLDLAKSQYYEGANAPYDALMKYASIIQPGSGIGGTSTTTQPTFGTNPLASMLPMMAMMYMMG